MASKFSLAIVLALSVAAVATVATTASTAEAAPWPGRVGVMFDAGVPDGFNGSLVYSPIRPLHVHAGLGTNLISLGLRAGASLYLLPTRVSPTLNAEVGHYFAGDANAAAGRFGLSDDSDSPILRELGYNYANLHLGLDVGRDRLSFYFHAGWSVVHTTLHHLDEAIEEDADDEDRDVTVQVGDNVRATIVTPSVRFGFLFFF